MEYIYTYPNRTHHADDLPHFLDLLKSLMRHVLGTAPDSASNQNASALCSLVHKVSEKASGNPSAAALKVIIRALAKHVSAKPELVAGVLGSLASSVHIGETTAQAWLDTFTPVLIETLGSNNLKLATDARDVWRDLFRTYVEYIFLKRHM